MKCKVIKDYAGILAGQEVEINDKAVNYMISEGYVEPIIEPIEPKKAEFVIEGSKLASALNKAIEPKYKRNR